jgi:hypothetical protein
MLKLLQTVCLLFAQLVIKLEPGLPHVELGSAVTKRIKAAVVKCYNDNSQALDYLGSTQIQARE